MVELAADVGLDRAATDRERRRAPVLLVDAVQADLLPRVGLEQPLAVAVAPARLDAAVHDGVLADRVVLVAKVRVARPLLLGHQELHRGGLEDEVVAPAREDEVGPVERADHRRDARLVAPPRDFGDEPVVVEAEAPGPAAVPGLVARPALAPPRALGRVPEAPAGKPLEAPPPSLARRRRERRLREDRRAARVVHEVFHEVAEDRRALSTQRPVAVDLAASTHVFEDVVAHVRQEERVVVHAHDPLVAQPRERRPDRDGVEADHVAVARGENRRRHILEPRRPAPAHLLLQQTEPDLRTPRERVRVRGAQVALVEDDHVRLADLAHVFPQRRHRRVERVAVRRVVGAVRLLAQIDDDVSRLADARASLVG
mmetsp:Transcript_243/g.736  ORF Transcript_243/g.736 Transcript_243/m.736 type:complete len:371 (-) Transcript_243:1046-2158(-)